MLTSNAQKLIGYTFETGWHVLREHSSSPSTTGGAYSMCFDVEKDGNVCFMKAFDFASYMLSKHPDVKNPMAKMKEMVDQYDYEHKLSDMCRTGHVTKVVFVTDFGAEYVDSIGIMVPYLIFDMADGDVHQVLDVSDRLDFAWKLKSLHDIAVGLKQLHALGISHQDVKPSNILLFDLESRLGDLGCALCDSIQSPFGDRIFTGDHNYAPPERDYHVNIEDAVEQKYLTDCYLLGSLITYYITGVSMNALLYKALPQSYHPTVYQGHFADVRDYLYNAFQQALEEIKLSVPMEQDMSNRLVSMIEYLCNPIAERRGHPKNINNDLSLNYNLERFITELDFLKRKAELMVYRKRS